MTLRRGLMTEQINHAKIEKHPTHPIVKQGH